MTATLDAVASKKKGKAEPTAEERAAEELVRRAWEQGLSLTGPDGLLKQLTKMVLELSRGAHGHNEHHGLRHGVTPCSAGRTNDQG